MNGQEPNLMDILLVVWKRKWQIVLPTFMLAVLAGLTSFLLPRKYEVDAIIRPSMIFVQNEQGNFQEVVVVDPKQVAGQINQKSYDRGIAAELSIDITDFPRLEAENIRDTQLVRVAITDPDIARAAAILNALFRDLEKEFNRKIEVEIKSLDSQVRTSEFEIGKRNLDIRSREIEQAKKREEIAAAKNRLKISEEKYKTLVEEMSSVRKRVDGLEAQQQEVLKQPAESATAISLLLYSSEVQQNLRYYNDLDEKLSTEKMAQEDYKLAARTAEQQIRQLTTEIDRLKTEIDDLQNTISLLKDKKGRIDYAQLVKEPTPSTNPVSPRKPFIVVAAGLIGLFFFVPLALFMEYLEKQKAVKNS